jgi:hypothetical protein
MIRYLSWRLGRLERRYLRTLDRAFGRYERAQRTRGALADRVARAAAHAALDNTSHSA